MPRFGAPTLYQLTRNSGFIFAGTVRSVTMVRADSQNAVGIVRIAFHVEHSFRGVRAGQTLIVREWAGLWEAGERYRVGERVTLFLFSPGKLGLTSQVGGSFGRFQIDSAGRVLIDPQHVAGALAGSPHRAPWVGGTRMSWREFSAGIRRVMEE